MSRLEHASHVAEVVSAIAVVVSILYLAHQIGENTAAIQFETNRGLQELQTAADEWEQDPSFVEVMIRGDSFPDSLSDVEWAQYARHRSQWLNVWSLAYDGYQKGTLDLKQWEAWDGSYGMCSAGARRVWEENAFWWPDDFREIVDGHIAECPEP